MRQREREKDYRRKIFLVKLQVLSYVIPQIFIKIYRDLLLAQKTELHIQKKTKKNYRISFMNYYQLHFLSAVHRYVCVCVLACMCIGDVGPDGVTRFSSQPIFRRLMRWQNYTPNLGKIRSATAPL
jgi:hypothetical protein